MTSTECYILLDTDVMATCGCSTSSNSIKNKDDVMFNSRNLAVATNGREKINKS
jgi:hypothetical protein